MTQDGAGPDLASTVDGVRDTARVLRDQAAELVTVLERLDPDGSGPPAVIADQKRLLAEIESTLRRLRQLDRRESELREG